MGKVTEGAERQILCDVAESLMGDAKLAPEAAAYADALNESASNILDTMIGHGYKPADVAYVCAVVLAQTAAMTMSDKIGSEFLNLQALVTTRMFVEGRRVMREQAPADPELARLLKILDAADPSVATGPVQ